MGLNVSAPWRETHGEAGCEQFSTMKGGNTLGPILTA